MDQENYSLWLKNEYFDSATKAELRSIQNKPDEIHERFGKELEFGTGGLRGIMEAGTNRMNIYTVRKASQGVAASIANRGSEAMSRGIVIAYDTRRNSDVFAMEAAKVFAGNGIKAYLFESYRATPILSFAVWYLFASAGIVITASHNPKEYNGYKVYGEDGGQMTPDGTGAIAAEIQKIADMTSIALMEPEDAKDAGLLQMIGSEVDDAYFSCIKKLVISSDTIKKYAALPKIVYTPLHGTGCKPVMRMFNETGFKHVVPVRSQQYPDGEFPTLTTTLNPEDKKVFRHALRTAAEEDADIILATDPDCDRVGVLCKQPSGGYMLLSGNQVGVLVLDYMLGSKQQSGQLPQDGFVVKTIVTTWLASTIAQQYEVELVDVLTGFKYIGEKIQEMDDIGGKKFLFGMEDSCGYLAGTCVRDKDGVIGCMLIAETAAYYKSRGLTLYDALQQLYEKYGYCLSKMITYDKSRKKQIACIKKFMTTQEDNMKKMGVLAVSNYVEQTRYDLAQNTTSPITLPKAEVYLYEFLDGSWICIRPSGTESKLKLYFEARGQTLAQAEKRLKDLQKIVFKN